MNITQRLFPIMLLVISCSSQPGYSKIGILIGLRQDVSLPASLPYSESAAAGRLSTYRTLWISLDASDSISIRNFKNVIVPRNDGFWRIEVIRQQAGDWTEAMLACSPIDQTPAMPPLDSMTVAECEGNKQLSLIFVGTDFLSYEGSSDGYCQGAAHPWHVNYLKTVSLDAPNSEGIAISQVLSEEAGIALLHGAQQYLTRSRDERLNPDPDENNWGVIRRRGQWILRGQLDYSAEVFRGHFAHFDIDFKPTNRLVGYNELAVSWQKIKEQVPAVRDAMTAPDKKWIIVLTRDQLHIYSLPDFKKIGATNLSPNEFVIMAQWADRSQVAEWSRTIRSITKRDSLQ